MINKLNNYRYNIDEPLYTNDNIDKIKQYIKSGKIPNDLNDIQMKRFIERLKYNYELKNNKVFYKHFKKNTGGPGLFQWLEEPWPHFVTTPRILGKFEFNVQMN